MRLPFLSVRVLAGDAAGNEDAGKVDHLFQEVRPEREFSAFR
jgi:hypothetical protein